MDVQYHNLSGSNYQSIWDFQKLLNNEIKIAKRSRAIDPFSNKAKGNFLNHLVFCEHKPVFTLGKSASEENLLVSPEELGKNKIELFDINRGGDITFHGPGQITGYLIFDLEQLYRDVHRYVRNIEECIILLLAEYGISGKRLNDFTGVWLEDEKGKRKICAIGVHLSRWVSMHGFGFNVNTELDYFNNIIPCGIADKDKSVTSIAKELGYKLDLEEIKEKLKEKITSVFNINLLNV